MLLRALGTAAKAVGLTAVCVPVVGVAALVASGAGGGEADAGEMLRSLPRTARIAWWGAWVSYKYKSLAARYAPADLTGGAAAGEAPDAADASAAAYQQRLAELHEHAATSLLLTCQANGGLYIKAGQLAVSLNAVPPQYRRILEALQDRVPPRAFADAQRVLQEELGGGGGALLEQFAEFAPLATAAASLAQVHRARLLDGREVAVKVQYPGLAAAVAADLATMLSLSEAAHWLFPGTSWRWLFEELSRQLQYELDFCNEAANAARVAASLAAAGRRDVAVPALVPSLCTARVLTMEWVEGCKITDVECIEQQGLKPRDVALLLLDAFAQQTYKDGFTHGDPHPGNILVRPRPDPPPLLERLLLGSQPRPQLVLLDHGVYVTLPGDLRRLYCQLWCAIVLGDTATARQAATELAGEQAGLILPEVLRPRNWTAVPPAERRKVRQEAGLTSFADLAKLLEEAPKQLLDSLRQSAVVRHTATLLGATVADRLRINAKWALAGCYVPAEAAGGPLRFVGGLQSRWQRWQLTARVGLLRFAFWVRSAVHAALGYLLLA